jgi:Fe-S-cluster containining protein
MSLPELFHHQRRFIGCLALRRVRTGAPPARDTIELAARILHPFADSGDHLLLAAQAYDDGVSGRCPALSPDGGCSIHADRKPALCSAVPLEPLLSDSQQGLVLSKRARDAAFLGANCLKPGAPAGSLPLLEASVPTAQSRAALEQRRAELAQDKGFWGDAVYRTLPAELFSCERVPTNGLLTLSIVPAVGVIARFSEACRLRCCEYLLAQATLIESTLPTLPAAAVQARRELNGFAKSGAALLQALAKSGVPVKHSAASELHAWLGVV